MSDRHSRPRTKAELEAMIARGKDRTDWSRIDALTKDEIAGVAQQVPDTFVGDAAFRQAVELLYPKAGKQRVTLRLDADVLDGFKSGSKGYRTRITAVLRDDMRVRRVGVEPAPPAYKPRRRT